MKLMDPKDLVLVFENEHSHEHLQRLDETMEFGPVSHILRDFKLIGVREDS